MTAETDRVVVEVASPPDFMNAIRDLFRDGYEWDESGLTLFNAPFNFRAEFTKTKETDQ